MDNPSVIYIQKLLFPKNIYELFSFKKLVNEILNQS